MAGVWHVIGGFLGSGFATALLGFLFLRRNRQIESEIKAHFDEKFKIFESTRSWKQQALFELFGPMQMQLDRTKLAFHRWREKNLYLEAKVVREGNLMVRDLLLTKGHLIPTHLMADAGQLIEHYDVWLEVFEKDRLASHADQQDVRFVYAGPEGHPFPQDAEEHFKAEFLKLRQELYGI